MGKGDVLGDSTAQQQSNTVRLKGCPTQNLGLSNCPAVTESVTNLTTCRIEWTRLGSSIGPEMGCVTNSMLMVAPNCILHLQAALTQQSLTHPALRRQALGPWEARGRWRTALLEAWCLLALEVEAEPRSAALGPVPEAVGLLSRWCRLKLVAVSQKGVGSRLETQVWEELLPPPDQGLKCSGLGGRPPVVSVVGKWLPAQLVQRLERLAVTLDPAVMVSWKVAGPQLEAEV